jgi:hypothetical protein
VKVGLVLEHEKLAEKVQPTWFRWWLYGEIQKNTKMVSVAEWFKAWNSTQTYQQG